MLWDPIRCCHVKETPEEKVRQAWIRHMIGPLQYPRGLLSVEKGIETVVQGQKSSRRVDILCFTPGGDGLLPLLILECKAENLGLRAEQQVLGYNYFICAPFVAIASQKGAKLFWQEESVMKSVPFLPSYEQLLQWKMQSKHH